MRLNKMTLAIMAASAMIATSAVPVTAFADDLVVDDGEEYVVEENALDYAAPETTDNIDDTLIEDEGTTVEENTVENADDPAAATIVRDDTDHPITWDKNGYVTFYTVNNTAGTTTYNKHTEGPGTKKTVAPTCSEGGYSYWTLSTSFGTLESDHIDLKEKLSKTGDHQYDAEKPLYETIKDATCQSYGVQVAYYICTVDNTQKSYSATSTVATLTDDDKDIIIAAAQAGADGTVGNFSYKVISKREHNYATTTSYVLLDGTETDEKYVTNQETVYLINNGASYGVRADSTVDTYIGLETTKTCTYADCTDEVKGHTVETVVAIPVKAAIRSYDHAVVEWDKDSNIAWLDDIESDVNGAGSKEYKAAYNTTNDFTVAENKIVLTDCSKDGKYTVSYYTSENSQVRSTQTVTVKAHHTYDGVAVAPVEGSEKINAWYSGSTLVVESNVCNKEATYVEYTLCASPEHKVTYGVEDAIEFNAANKKVKAGKLDLKISSTSEKKTAPKSTVNHVWLESATNAVSGENGAVHTFQKSATKTRDEFENFLKGLKKDVKGLKVDLNGYDCEQGGTIKLIYVCDLCGAEKEAAQIAIPKYTHKYPTEHTTENEVKPTCYKAGSYDEVDYCTICGKELSRVNVPVAKTAHGFYREDGVAKYYVDGKFQEDVTGLVTVAGNQYLVGNGILMEGAEGLITCPDGVQRWFSMGHFRQDYSGWAMRAENGIEYWYIVKNGVLDTEANGLYEKDQWLYAVSYGRLLRETTDVYMTPDGTWVYLTKGWVDELFSGKYHSDRTGGDYVIEKGYVVG